MLTTLPRPSASDAWRRVCFRVLHGVPSTLEALIKLATLRSAEAGAYVHAELASELGEKLLQRTVASVHASVFDEWLGSPPEAQARELGQFLASAGRNGHAHKRLAAESFQHCIPETAAPPKRLIFETDLSILLRVLNEDIYSAPSQRGANRAAGRTRHWAVSAAMREIKSRGGNVGLTLARTRSRLAVSPEHLGRMFRKHAGVPYRSYLRAFRIFRAAVLIDSGMPTSKVAEELGYKDVHEFRRDFLNAMGRSPLEYRWQKASLQAFHLCVS